MLAAGCAGSGEPPRPPTGIADGMPQDAFVSLGATGSLEGPTPPALVPQAADIQTEVNGSSVGEPAQPTPSASASVAPAIAAAAPTAAPGATAVTLAPFVGLPDNAASNLSRALAARAPAYGLQLVPSGMGSAALTVRGYLAAVPAEHGISAIHIWDIYDGNGRRLHRVEGSHALDAGADWANLPSSAWMAVADRAWGELAAWLKSRAG